METANVDLLRRTILFASLGQIAICTTTAVALHSIWRVGHHSEGGQVRKDTGVLWLARACVIWVIVGGFQLYYAITSPDLSLFIPNLADKAPSAIRATRQFLSIVNSICLLISAAHFEIYKDPQAWLPIQRIAVWLRSAWIQNALWFWAVVLALIVHEFPQAFYVVADVMLSVFTSFFVLYGLFRSFKSREFLELAYTSAFVLIPIALAQFGEVLPQFGHWRWIMITVFKAMLCLLFIALTYSWMYKQFSELSNSELPPGVIPFPKNKPWLDTDLVLPLRRRAAERE